MIMTSNNLIRAAIYARVSTEQQATQQTIVSQVAALRERVAADGLLLDDELVFLDNGCSGGTLIRPALERLRDVAYAGGFNRLYVHSPDRLARKYAHQVVLVEELQRWGIELFFLNRSIGETPEEQLLLQVQGMIAEYERAKIGERTRRGRRHAAQSGAVSVLGKAPFGYRYVTKQEANGAAYYEVVPEAAVVVRQMFEWIARDRLSIGEVRRRLTAQGIRTPKGHLHWQSRTIWGMLKNPAYKGAAAFGKTRAGERRPRVRPSRNQPAVPLRMRVSYPTAPEERVTIAVPAIVSAEIFDAVQEQLIENRRQQRERCEGRHFFLQGLLQCGCCQHAYYGKLTGKRVRAGRSRYSYYRCLGTDAHRFGGERVCANKQVRVERLDEAVWKDVSQLLRDPEMLRAEFDRRLRSPIDDNAEHQQLLRQQQSAQRGISRLIDAYETGLLDKAEFEPRLANAKSRIKQITERLTVVADQAAQATALNDAVTHLNDFCAKVREGLDRADDEVRRQIVRTLVKVITIDANHVRITYRINPRPFRNGPARGLITQHCERRANLARGASPWDATKNFPEP
jgi:site-specific DNA recombinase